MPKDVKEHLPSHEFLPLSPGAVSAAFKSMVADITVGKPSGHAVLEEQQILRTQNPLLHEHLVETGMHKAEAHPEQFSGEAYYWGALFCHRALREQAKMYGFELPTLSADILLAYQHDLIDIENNSQTFESFVSKVDSSGEPANLDLAEVAKLRLAAIQSYREKFEQIKRDNPSVAVVIDTMGEVYPWEIMNSFSVGFIDVYLTFQAHFEARKLSRLEQIS